MNTADAGTVNLNNRSATIGALTGTRNLALGSGAVAIGNNGLSTTYSGALSGGSLTKIGTGTLTLTGASTYTGGTIISAGTLALSGSGSINNSASISIAAGATFDVSAISSYTLISSTTLSAAGTASAATIKGASAGTVNLGSQPITLTYDGSHPALTISQGTLSLNGNAFTVNTASALGSGNYTLAQQASGNITSSGTFTVSGTAIDSTHYGIVSVSAGNVVLTVALKPTVAGKSYSRAPGVAYKIYASDLAATATVDTSLGYTATFDHCASTTANSVTLGNNGQSGNSAIILYPGSAANSGDSLSYTINDGHGGTVSGTVTITINTNVTGQASINLAGQTATLGLFGMPGYHYVVQRSVNSLNNWQDLINVTTSNLTPGGTSVDGNGVITAPSGGAFTVTDPSPPPSPTSVYYKLRAAP
jgi:autotransporter-associated beta strand protein